MAQKPRELGERQHEDRRTGVGPFGGWKGVVREGNPSSIPDDTVWNAENVRLSGGIFSPRGGQAKVNTASISAIQGFYDATDIGAASDPTPPGPGGRYLYLTATKADGFTRSILRLDTVASTLDEVQIGSTYDGVNAYYELFALLEGASDGAIYSWGAIRTPGSATDEPLVIKIAGFPSLSLTTNFTLGALPELGAGIVNPCFDQFSAVEDPVVSGKFYAGLSGPMIGGIAQSPAIYRDGVLDDTAVFTYVNPAATNSPLSVSFNNTVYVAWGIAPTNTIRKRTGALNWSNLTLPATPILNGKYLPGAASGARPIVYSGKLWVPGCWYDVVAANIQGEMLSVTTGDVVTREHTVGSNHAVSGTDFYQASVFNSKLYYVWAHPVDANPSRLGVYDGVTWTDNHWDCKIGATQYTLISIAPAESDAGTLYGHAIKSSDSSLWIVKSSGTDTTTWSTVVQITSGSQPFRGAIVASDS